MRRTPFQKFKDFLTFPVRAFTLFHEDRFGLSCQATERYDYVASAVIGRALDMGCGTNRLVRDFLNGNGVGVDVYKYEENHDGLIFKNLLHLPFNDGEFDSVTFLANFSHIPENEREPEIAEACRVVRPGGNIIVTMALPLVEVLVHQLIWLYDRLFGTHLDHDNERGMKEGESYYLTEREIRRLLTKAGFEKIIYRPFWTQWGMNGMYIGWKS